MLARQGVRRQCARAGGNLLWAGSKETHQAVARLDLLQLKSLDAGFRCPTVPCSYNSIRFLEIPEIQEI